MAATPRHKQHRVPRFDRSEIRESSAELQRMLRAFAGQPEEDRLRLLLLLRGDARLSVDGAAVQLGRARRTMSRWLQIYRAGGIEALMRTGSPGRPRRLNEAQAHALSETVATRKAGSTDDLRRWLFNEFGVEYTERGVRSVLRRDVPGVARGWIMLHGRESSVQERSASADGNAGAFIALLNALPTTTHAVEWIPAFRDALLHVLPDVDRISVNVDVNCNLADPDSYRPRASITQHVEQPGGARQKVRVSVSQNADDTPSQRLVRNAISGGFDAAQYHPPTCLDYYLGESGYVGSLILWRFADKPPIGAGTLQLVESLRPFILFALSDLVARHRSEQPIQLALSRALGRLASQSDLTDQEQRVVMLQFMGHSYKEMADILNVTLDTVKKHFKQVHRKTGTRSQSELFARYFTYKID